MTEDTRQIALAIPPAAGQQRPTLFQRHQTTIRTAVSLLAGLALWEVVGQYIVTDRLFFVPFTHVLASLRELVTGGTLAKHLYVSGLEFGVGFALAAAVGIVLGILMGSSRWLHQFLDPWVSVLYATPLVALTPFFILVFGIGVESKMALVFTLAVFPVLINTFTGIRSVERNYLEVAHSFSATQGQIFVKVLIPSSVPFIISGLRLASGRALIGVVVGELLFSNAGVGHLLSISAQTFNTAQLFAGVLIFALAGLLATSLLKRLEAWLAPWRVEP